MQSISLKCNSNGFLVKKKKFFFKLLPSYMSAITRIGLLSIYSMFLLNRRSDGAAQVESSSVRCESASSLDILSSSTGI